MSVNDYLLMILQAVIIAVVPIAAAALRSWVRQLIEIAKEKSESEKMRQYLDEIGQAVETAVACTSQTYVDALKRGGEFNKDEQKEALSKSLEAARGSLSPWIKDFIYSTYGDVDTYLTQRIEAQVRKQKQETWTE